MVANTGVRGGVGDAFIISPVPGRVADGNGWTGNKVKHGGSAGKSEATQARLFDPVRGPDKAPVAATTVGTGGAQRVLTTGYYRGITFVGPS